MKGGASAGPNAGQVVSHGPRSSGRRRPVVPTAWSGQKNLKYVDTPLSPKGRSIGGRRRRLGTAIPTSGALIPSDAAPVTLKSPFRIEALFSCQFIALLLNCLIERELRQAMARERVRELPLYHEQRACTAPTAARVFDHFTGVQRHHLTRNGRHLQTFDPQLTDPQRQLLDLLAVPANAYTSGPLS